MSLQNWTKADMTASWTANGNWMLNLSSAVCCRVAVNFVLADVWGDFVSSTSVMYIRRHSLAAVLSLSVASTQSMVSALLTKNHPHGWIVPHFDTTLVCQKLLLIARWLNSVIFCWFMFVIRVQASEDFLSEIWCSVLDVWSVTSTSLHSPTLLPSSHGCLSTASCGAPVHHDW